MVGANKSSVVSRTCRTDTQQASGHSVDTWATASLQRTGWATTQFARVRHDRAMEGRQSWKIDRWLASWSCRLHMEHIWATEPLFDTSGTGVAYECCATWANDNSPGKFSHHAI